MAATSMSCVVQQARLVSMATTATSSSGGVSTTCSVMCGSDSIPCLQRSPPSARCSSARPLLAAPQSRSSHLLRLERADALFRSTLHPRPGSSRRPVVRARAAKDRSERKKGASERDGKDQELVKVVVHRSQESDNLVSEQGTAASFLQRLPLPSGQEATWWIAGGVAAAVLTLVGVSAALIRRAKGQEERPVDSLARRGFIAADRAVPLRVIREFDDPTSVRNYRIGNATLVELEPLPPLTTEKMEFHRQQRRKEHGWKKPQLVLVEGDPVPDGVDPMTVRFIPRRHPFSLNQGEGEEELSEEVARRRLMQRRGRPEKEQERSRRQLERLRREVEEKDRLEREERERNQQSGGRGRQIASTGDMQ